jgi:hypothetical protein
MNKLVTILEIFKRNLSGLNFKTEICWEGVMVGHKMEKVPCLKVTLNCDEDFRKTNENNIQGKIFLNKIKGLIDNNIKNKREMVPMENFKSKSEKEKDCLDNINEFFK